MNIGTCCIFIIRFNLHDFGSTQHSSTSVQYICVAIQTCRREKSSVPQLVKQCVSDVENWHQGSTVGLNETGLYRVSGTLTEILELKRLIDKEAVLHAELLKNRDIHTLTGTL